MRIGAGEDQTSLNGRVVKLLALDDGANARQALRLAKNLCGHRSVWAVIGHLTTGCTLSAIPEYNAAKLIHISPVATGDDLEARSPYTFRTILSENQQVISLADYIYRAVDSKNLALVYEDSPLGNRMGDCFLSRGRAMGISAVRISVEARPFPNLTEAIDEVVSIGPDAIFLAGGPHLGGMIVRKWPEKTQRPLIFGTYRLVSDEFTELAGNQGKGVLAAHPCVWKPDFEKGGDIKNRYEKTFKYIMDWLAIQTYDAVDLLLWAGKKSGLDGDSMSGALRGLNCKSSSFPGLTGPIYFNPDGSLARGVTVATYTGKGWRLWEPGEAGSKQ